MSVWPQSNEVGKEPAKLPGLDKIPDEARMDAGTVGITNKQEDPEGAYVRTKDSQVVANDGIADVAVFGRRTLDGQFGLFVAPGGVNADTATDAELIFNSNQNVFKIVDIGYATAPVNSSAYAAGPGCITFPGVPVEVNHDLGFTPIVWGFIEIGSRYYPLPYTSFVSPNAAGMVTQTVKISADDNKVYIETDISVVVVAALGGSFDLGGQNIKYYLLQETAD